jgi:hypothetical protein
MRPQLVSKRHASLGRFGPADLETLDALITAGIAATRAEACAGHWPASASNQHMSSSSG